LRDLCMVKLVSKGFNEMITGIPEVMVLLILEQLQYCCKKISGIIDQFAKKDDRILFLEKTVIRIQSTFSDEKLKTTGHPIFMTKIVSDIKWKALACFTKITGCLVSSLRETEKILTLILNKTEAMTPNFDIYEFTLIRYTHQIERMFIEPCSPQDPIGTQKLSNPELIIYDARAQNAWRAIFGHHTYFVSFSQFEEKFICELLKGSDDEIDRCSWKTMQKAIQFLTHFPNNDTITPYAVNILCCHFGPFDNVIRNIKMHALQKGFLGLLNLVSAEEILCSSPNKFLVRFSREKPECLTVSCNISGELRHTRKSPTESIADVIANHTAWGLSPVNQYCDWPAIAQNNDLQRYASRNKSYYY